MGRRCNKSPFFSIPFSPHVLSLAIHLTIKFHLHALDSACKPLVRDYRFLLLHRSNTSLSSSLSSYAISAAFSFSFPSDLPVDVNDHVDYISTVWHRTTPASDFTYSVKLDMGTNRPPRLFLLYNEGRTEDQFVVPLKKDEQLCRNIYAYLTVCLSRFSLGGRTSHTFRLQAFRLL